jgi:hypothetical protein
MVNRAVLTDEQWAIIVAFLSGFARVYVGAEKACRRFVEAAPWVLRSGTQW